MTHLRKMMLEELQRRNYAETTINSYIRIVEDFSLLCLPKTPSDSSRVASGHVTMLHSLCVSC